MSTGSPKRKRADRVAALRLPPGTADQLLELLRRRDVVLRLLVCLLAVLMMWGLTKSWVPPFPYRSGDVPQRTIIARVDFKAVNKAETERLQEEARKEVHVIYEHDPRALLELLEELKGKVFQIIRAESWNTLDNDVRSEFFDRSSPDEPTMMEDLREDIFDNFRLAMQEDMDLAKFDAALKRAFTEHLTNGLLKDLAHSQEEATLLEIRVRPQGSDEPPRLIETNEVRIAEVLPELKKKLSDEFDSDLITEPIFYWLQNELPRDEEFHLKITDAARAATERDRDEAAAKVPPQTDEYKKGETVLAPGGEPLVIGQDAYQRLKVEHDARLAQMSLGAMALHSLADFGMYVAMYVLCGFYIFFHQPRLLIDWRKYITLQGFVVVTIALAWLMANDSWRAEAIPLVLFAMTAAIAYRQEVALLLSGAVCLIFTISAGQGLAEFTMLLATMAAAILLLGRIRSRTKLLYVGIAAGTVALLTSLGVGTLAGQNVGTMLVGPVQMPVLLVNSLWLGFCAVIAGLLMTGLLPFIEYVFDVQTDISLLELGDAAHPLLQELVRRAPGTYNHSINVASIAEAAADAIGANGLLCRVGAYFHDIGKMLKPGYFVENQGDEGNRHESLMPAMSTLVIIAHVKDGADLARQHGLPQAIIDFIQQHHGTTLVEYFYRRASQQSEADPDASDVEESDFRYPGPKPQSREAGVVMLADSVESACRTLVEPTPSRIESLVKELAMKRLLDGQFDESGLTLSELRAIETSLVKSLTAVYHGRVKYPDQQTA